MSSAAALRRRLVERLPIRDGRVREAFLTVPRELFVPAFAAGHRLEDVYRDEVIVTKLDERGLPICSSSQPIIRDSMLDRLRLEPELSVLEIGAGTGYNAALLKTLVGPRGRVVTIDVDPELARNARRALRQGGFAVRVVCGDGRVGYPRGAPYDRIVATVGTDSVPRAWRDQLVEGGLLELPLRLERGEQLVATFRRDGERLESVAVVAGGFMPLRGSSLPQPPLLLASESHLSGAAQTPLVQLQGAGLQALSPTARRRLLALALGRARRIPLRGALPRGPLRLHLSLALPDRRIVESPPIGVGAVGPGGRSLALADTAYGDPTLPPTRHLLAWGGLEAESYLLRTVERWRAAGCPGAEQLRLSVELDGGDSRIALHH
jgi:protein-L-isoaspartate(D-aspartate) O-methyltransferase